MVFVGGTEERGWHPLFVAHVLTQIKCLKQQSIFPDLSELLDIQTKGSTVKVANIFKKRISIQ